ncbi:MAG: hypothetical protein HY240_00390 [Actinobacteria bacterium]|nr:hypothetical protein [Actinomycetota bacterium]
MTDRPQRRPRLAKGWVRAIAWISGGTAFFSALGVIGVAPKPAVSAPKAAPRRVIIRRIIKRVVIVDPAPGVPVVASAPTVTSSGGGVTSQPTSTTGGSHP